MKHMTRDHWLTLAVALSLGLVSCGGGGSSSNSGGGASGPNHAPAVSSISAAPAGPSSGHLTEFSAYTFTATVADPDLGDTVGSVEWDFLGEGAATAGAATTVSAPYVYSASGTFQVRARATDGRGMTGAWSSPVSVTVDASTSPLAVTLSQPTTAQVLSAPLTSQTNTLTFTISVVNTGNGTLSASGIHVNAGETGATVGTAVDQGAGVWTVPVSYPASATIGSRTVTPQVWAVDSNGISSPMVTGPTITVNTVATTSLAPIITISSPGSTTPTAYTSKPVSLVFSLQQSENYPLSYTVTWGDGKTDTGATGTAATNTGVAVTLNHTYADTFTASSASALMTLAATTNIPGGTASATRTFTVIYNTLPTATITAPQASGSAPTGLSSSISKPYTVVPMGGNLSFTGTGTVPLSGDSNLSFHWDIPGSDTVSVDSQNSGTVTFGGESGKIDSYNVVLTVTDAFGRKASTTKTILVDGLNTQQFTLAFMYRKKSDNNGLGTLSPVTTSTHGLGAIMQILQDGQTSAYAVDNNAGAATVSVPVRSDLPFYVKIPSFNSSDTDSYLMRIPNAPTGAYADSTLVSPSSTGAISTFTFVNSTAPWNPTLKVVTAQGFADEGVTGATRTLAGNTSLVLGTTLTNNRWLDRLSVPLTDQTTSAISWTQSSNNAYQLSGVLGYQLFAEWPILLLTRPTSLLDTGNTPDTTTSAGANTDLGCVLDYSKYAGDNTPGDSFAAFSMQAFRVPAGTLEPYPLSPAWESATAELNSTAGSVTAGLHPTRVDASVPSFYYNLIHAGDSTGGIASFTMPYVSSDVDRKPLAVPVTRSADGSRKVFAFTEYLWSSVWARPLVLNSARPNYVQTLSLASYLNLRYSHPGFWPSEASIYPGTVAEGYTSFDLTPGGGGTFTGSTPVGVNGAAAVANQGVGRFFWTAYTPAYSGDANPGSAISRTWLADSNGQPPTSYLAATTDALAGFGFMTPQDTKRDLRARDANGVLTGVPTGGFRVYWYNPTKDGNGDPVPPDFWVVEIKAATTSHFLLPASFPAGTQSVTDPILTDARTYLPSGGTTWVSTDTVAPGYCWFDIPADLRPTTSSTITVFGIKSILNNNPVSAARVLNRPDWVEAIKTVTSNMVLKPASGTDLSYVHKIPFNFPWDIVVVNGPATVVGP